MRVFALWGAIGRGTIRHAIELRHREERDAEWQKPKGTS